MGGFIHGIGNVPRPGEPTMHTFRDARPQCSAYLQGRARRSRGAALAVGGHPSVPLCLHGLAVRCSRRGSRQRTCRCAAPPCCRRAGAPSMATCAAPMSAAVPPTLDRAKGATLEYVGSKHGVIESVQRAEDTSVEGAGRGGGGTSTISASGSRRGSMSSSCPMYHEPRRTCGRPGQRKTTYVRIEIDWKISSKSSTVSIRDS